MIVFLAGPDDWRRLQKRKFVMGEFQKKHPGGAVVFFEDENGIQKIYDFLRQNSLFEEKKLGIVKDIEIYPELQKTWKEIANNKNTTLIIESRKIPPKSSPLSKIQVTREEFPELTGKEWKSFVAKSAKEMEVKTSAEALNFLTEAYEGDSWRVMTELQKLSSLHKEISNKDLVNTGLLAATPEFWPIINSLKSWIPKERLKALATLNLENEPAAKTFNILAASWNEKMPQFAAFDVAIKSGKLEYEEALLDAVL